MFNPGEAVIWKFSKTQDTTIPTVYSLKNIGHNLISMEFNTKIVFKNLFVEIDDLKILGMEMLADLRTVQIKTEEMNPYMTYKIHIKCVESWNGTANNINLDMVYYPN